MRSVQILDVPAYQIRCVSTFKTKILGINCFTIQGSRTDESLAEESIYWQDMKEKDPIEMARSMIAMVSEMHTKVRNELKHGRYDWFKPIYGSNIFGKKNFVLKI